MPNAYGPPASVLPWDAGSQAADAMEGYPLTPYGMGDCRTFMDIPPLVHMADGSVCVNPDFAAVRRFSIQAVGRDPAGAPTQSLAPEPTLAPGDTVEMQLSVEREENGLGHTLITELAMFTDPPARVDGIMVQIKTLQGDRVFMNAPVPAVNVFGNGHLGSCLPCPIMLYPNQTLIFSVTNNAAPPVDIRVRIVAKGKRFLPYHNMGLAQELEQCWGRIQTTPFWLQLDGDGEVALPAGVVGALGTAQAQMSIPGGGFFEMVWPRVQLIATAGALTADEIDVEMIDGEIGRAAMDGPVSLGGHYAAESKTVAGFTGNTFRAAQAQHCPPPTQIYRGNTRLFHNFTNRNVAAGAGLIRLTYAGCMHYVSRCPPQADLDLVRRYGHGDAHALRKAQERGDHVFLSFFDQNPLYVEDDTECVRPTAPRAVPPPVAAPAQPPVFMAPPVSAAPRPVQIVSMHRPDAPYHGPGSQGALPPSYGWGVDSQGRTHLIIYNPQTGALVRLASPQETAPFAAWLNQINSAAGLDGMGGAPRGDWESI